MKQRPPSARRGRQGVNIVEQAVLDELNWIFREQPADEDYGIDAQIEVVDDQAATGMLLGVQIKCGGSYFTEPSDAGWWFRPSSDDVSYWLNHSLPVLIVLVDPETRDCFWQLVRQDVLDRSSRGGWKLQVPKANRLDASADGVLREAAQGDPYLLRLRELQLARPWMDILNRGQRLVIDIEEWINKSSGRGEITLGIDNEDGRPPQEIATWGVMLGGLSYTEVVPKLFAWADVTLHEETYDEAEYEEYEIECVRYDEGDRIVLERYEDWRGRYQWDPLRPYTNVMNEVDKYRWELTLNDLGRGFLAFDRFAAQDVPLLTADPPDE
ncbi:DUF4365 domain-containing protein [Nocardia huaxiensis]|uniref:DUF4365 domain-containing protein n=1 Tax=Nocardia huaxiensis TaxID=2755382 RepID=A0A7D6ZLR8_9NOCA|nr:DUF4365 domain-containing protein [Nocardia huaxiensis]QLY30403.1 DUF4365 domain-containing protein [Nocardia huaxiensis]